MLSLARPRLPTACVRFERGFLLCGGLFASCCKAALGRWVLSQFLPGGAPLIDGALVLGPRGFRDLAGNAGVVLGDEIIAFRDANLVTASGFGRRGRRRG